MTRQSGLFWRRAVAAAGLLLLAVAFGGLPVARLAAPAADAPVVRARFIANSDSPFDQSVKEAVRDRVLALLGARLASPGSAATLARALQAALPSIEAAAQAEARAQGATYAVRVSYANAWFPEESLGRVRVDAGRYPALVVRLGQAAGHNWWGVLFPPLSLLGLPWASLPVRETGDAAAFDLSSLDPATLSQVRQALGSFSASDGAVPAFRLRDETILIVNRDRLSAEKPEIRWFVADMLRAAGRRLADSWHRWLAVAQAAR